MRSSSELNARAFVTGSERCFEFVSNRSLWPGWAPLLLLVIFALAIRSSVVPWVFMWLLSFAIFFGCKWLSWWPQFRFTSPGTVRSLGYLLAWPGMDAKAFLDPEKHPSAPQLEEWMVATSKTALGVFLLWGVVRRVPENQVLLAGWIGMLGIVLMLHFGMFHLLSLTWRFMGADAQPIMRAPVCATSLSDFWGRRWNLGFRQLTHQFVFEPVRNEMGVAAAIIISFVVSGLIHESVISFPARSGYGLPTLYFLLQGLGLLFERSFIGRKIRLGYGIRGWSFAAFCSGALAPLLFPETFVLRVIVPFLSFIGAR